MEYLHGTDHLQFTKPLNFWTEIHQALLSWFFPIVDFFIGKLVNLSPLSSFQSIRTILSSVSR